MTVRQVRALAALARAQLRYKAAQARAEKAKKARDARLEAATPHLPVGDWVTAGPFMLRLRIAKGSERFRLKDYRAAGGHVSRNMSKFITLVDGRRDLDVRHDLEAPAT